MAADVPTAPDNLKNKMVSDFTNCCGCRVCMWKCDPVDKRTIRHHLKKYGRFNEELSESSESDTPLNVDDFSQETGVETWFGADDLSQKESKFEQPCDEGSQRTSDDELSSSDSSGNEIQESSSESSENDSQENCWSFNYRRDLYSEEIATSILPGSTMTLLQWLALNFDLFSSHPSISKSAFSDYLLLQRQLQQNPSLPKSYTEARRLISPFLLKKKVFSVCINECVIFRDSKNKLFADLNDCPMCSEPRFYKKQQKRPTSKRSFTYLPVGPCLARLHGEANLAQIIQSHGRSAKYEVNEIWDIHDSPSWKDLYSETGFFRGDNMGLSLALELDGVNPYHNIGVAYSMTPIMITVLNWPRHMRNAFGNIFLVGIIPGNKTSESNNLDPYIEILIDELMYLSGCTTYSAYINAPVDIKIKLLFYVLDYPGLSKLFGQHGSGSLMGCHWCLIRGRHCPHNSKVIYLSNRSYLQMNDAISQDTKHFIDKSEDFSLKPILRDYAGEEAYRKAFDSAKNKTHASIMATATGCKGMRAINSLSGHNRLEQTQPDACHTIKDVVQNVMNLITGRNVCVEKIIKSEMAYERLDSETFENMEVADTITSQSNMPLSQPQASKKRKRCPRNFSFSNQVRYFLTKEELKIADERAMTIRPPLGFGTKPLPFISKPGVLKSHDWKQLSTQGILKYCLRGMMDKKHRLTLFMLFDSISDLCSESQCLDDLDNLEIKINKALACLERDFPVSLQNITTHLLHHVVDGIRKFGPVYGTWMYVFERFNSWICKRALNMRYPEATAVETFIIFDWCQFMKASGKMPCLKDLDNGEIPLVIPETVDAEQVDASSKIHECKPVKPTKKEIQAIRKTTGHSCSECIYKMYFSHVELHLKTHRQIFYRCAVKEKCSNQTISSIVFRQQTRGPTSTKTVTGKFIQFGRIQYFCDCSCSGGGFKNKIAKIRWFEGTDFDYETALWFCKNDSGSQTSYEMISVLSRPLLTALEGSILWILNSGLMPFEISSTCSLE